MSYSVRPPSVRFGRWCTFWPWCEIQSCSICDFLKQELELYAKLPCFDHVAVMVGLYNEVELSARPDATTQGHCNRLHRPVQTILVHRKKTARLKSSRHFLGMCWLRLVQSNTVVRRLQMNNFMHNFRFVLLLFTIAVGLIDRSTCAYLMVHFQAEISAPFSLIITHS